MLVSYGWCCAEGCREIATRRVSVGIGKASPLLVPVCIDHARDVRHALADLDGHDLAMVTDDRGSKMEKAP